MENSPIIRFRIDREIAERAHRMAAQNGLELPDVMRMMLTKAVRLGDFSIDRDTDSGTARAEGRPTEAYEPRYWTEVKAALDAETALAVLHQAIAEQTAGLDEGIGLEAPDLQRLERIRCERDEALALLASFDPKDTAAVAKILQRYAPDASPDSASKEPG
jgi:antitoxin component of RelBE/YafQ-DinJ toxin-antitoxin module